MRRREFITALGGATVTAAWPLTIASSAVAQAPRADWPKSLTIGTASPGGVYIVYGEALAKILTEKLGVTVNQLPTQGGIHNVKLLDTGGAQLGMIPMGLGLEAWNGTGDWTKGQKFRQMRALFPMYVNLVQSIVLRRSGITTFEQLDKKRVGVGPKAASSAIVPPEIMKILGISAEIKTGSHDAMASQLLAGDIDAIVTVVGAPYPAAQEVETKEPVTFLNFSPEQIEAIRKAMLEFSPSKIAAGTYRSLDKDCITVGVPNFVVGRTDLPDDLTYQLVKAVFENQPRLVKATSVASETLPQNALKDTFLPFHPGAVRYYREIGISIPDALAATH